MNNIINATHAELLATKDASGLIAGQKYRMTDYRTTITMHFPDELLHGEIEPLILTALNSNTFDPWVKSEAFPADDIQYDITINYTGLPSPNNYKTGEIVFRRDTFQRNSAYFDFKTKKTRRYAISPTWQSGFRQWRTDASEIDPAVYVKGEVIYQDNILYLCYQDYTCTEVIPQVWGEKFMQIFEVTNDIIIPYTGLVIGVSGETTITIPPDLTSYYDYWAFPSGSMNTNYGVAIEDIAVVGENSTLLSCNIGTSQQTITLCSQTGLEIKKNCSNIAMLSTNPQNYNTIGSECQNIFIQGEANSNVIGNQVRGATVFSPNTVIGDRSIRIFVRGSLNVIGSDADSIIITDGNYIKVLSNAMNVVVGLATDHVVIGESCQIVDVGKNSSYIAIGQGCSSIIIPMSSSQVSIGNNVTGMQFASAISKLNVLDGVSGNSNVITNGIDGVLNYEIGMFGTNLLYLKSVTSVEGTPTPVYAAITTL